MKPDKAWFCVIVGVVFMALAVFAFVTADDLTAASGRGALRGPTWLAYGTVFIVAALGAGLGVRALITWKRC